MAKFEHKPKRKVLSFSSSLLESIYHSTEESMEDHINQNRRKNSVQVDEEIENLRRAIRIEKWMENYSTPRHLSSNSGSSTDSSTFFSETESSASKTTPRSSLFTTHKPKNTQTFRSFQMDTIPRHEGRLTRTKSKAMRIYGELKKVKEPASPAGKIANFLNSIFSPKKNQESEDWSSIRKSKSMKDNTTCALASRSCLTKNTFSKSVKSKRPVRFNENTLTSSMPSPFVNRKIDTFRVHEEKGSRKHGLFRDMCNRGSDIDDKSCASSDLFELENIGRDGIGAYEQELPVYETTSLNAIATRFGHLVQN